MSKERTDVKILRECATKMREFLVETETKKQKLAGFLIEVRKQLEKMEDAGTAFGAPSNSPGEMIHVLGRVMGDIWMEWGRVVANTEQRVVIYLAKPDILSRVKPRNSHRRPAEEMHT